MGHWRYQPVWGEDLTGEKWYSFCEVYFDKDGKLDGWTEDPRVAPMGNDPEDLRGALARMLEDSWKWKPVKFDELKVGMQFERAITQEQADKVASVIEGMAGDAAFAALSTEGAATTSDR